MPPADRIVFLSIVLILLAGDILFPGTGLKVILAWLRAHGDVICTACIGGAVGFAELVSRYRDAPWQVALLPPGRTYIAINAAASLLALFLMYTFRLELHTPDSMVMTVILAGTGAMVAVRTKIFTLHQPGGSDVAVGPAFILDTVLAAVNRDADRLRAQRRIERVAARATKLRALPFAKARGYLSASLAAFQNLDVEVSRKLRDDLKSLVDDKDLSALDNEVKFLIAGYSILTEFGDTTFEAVFTALELYLAAQLSAAPPNPAS